MIFERTVAVNHTFDGFTRAFFHFRLKAFDEFLSVSREEFNAVFGCEVAPQNSVFFVIPASVNGRR